jgi:hypothetical protein
MRESSVQQRIRLDAAYGGIELWRNNVGVLLNDRGQPVRFGLGNDSAGLNARIKSSDLIGVTPVFVTPELVGRVLGVFTAIECKEEGWRMTPSDERAIAQAAFHDIVKRAGGFAGFAQSVEDFRKIVRR